jgi:hypothetical protein
MFPMRTDAGTFYRPAIFGVDPQNGGTVYLGTDSFNDGHSKGLWKSVDCGATWTHVSTGRNGDAIDGGRNWTFAIDPTNSQTMYINSGYNKLGLFKSVNGGVDWDDVTPKSTDAPGFVSHVRMDPEDPKHLLLDWHSNCGKFEDNIGCFHESKDGGATWISHYGNPSWPGQVVVWLLHGSTWALGADGIKLSTDGGQNWQATNGSGAGGHSAGQLYKAKDGRWYVGTTNGIVRGDPTATNFELIPNSGQYALGITGSDTDLYLSTANGFLTSPVADGGTWKEMPGSPKDSTACTADYDRDHHLLYASCLSGGFWRMRTQ